MFPISRTVEDIATIRALAHPVRLAILDLLQLEATANATECAQETGESPQTCSYHLRTLAKHGFVKRVESEDGRETRWELVRRGLELSTSSQSAPAFVAAATLLQRHLLERDDRAVSEFLRHEKQFDDVWQEAATFTSGTLVVGPEEVRELARDVGKVLKRFEARKGKSKDAKRVHVVFRAVPRVEKRRRK